jgi:acetyltransferase-like isoleucine patch superfamily enzyme
MSVMSSIVRVLRKVLVNVAVGSKLFPRPWRPMALRALGVACGPSVVFSEIFVDGRDVTNISIGAGSVLNNQIYLDATATVAIGDRVGMASRVRVLTATHAIGPHEMRMGAMVGRPVVIGHGVWIGADTTILPGVTIGDGTVIGAGSLVTKDCESDAVYVGRPARLLRRLPPGAEQPEAPNDRGSRQ